MMSPLRRGAIRRAAGEFSTIGSSSPSIHPIRMNGRVYGFTQYGQILA